MQLGGSGKKYPTFIIQDSLRKQNYPFDDETFSTRLDMQEIETWVNAFFAGKLRPHIKTEVKNAKESKHDHKHIVRVTGANFADVIMDKTKDVIVNFYSPHCSHCKKFSAVWEAFGEALCGIDTIVVAQMDAISNDPPPGVIIGVGGFPTIKIFPANNKNKPIDFTASKTVLDLVLFLQQYARYMASIIFILKAL